MASSKEVSKVDHPYFSMKSPTMTSGSGKMTSEDSLGSVDAEMKDILLNVCEEEQKERNKEHFSEILDTDCGEPLVSQNVRIDFNPLEGVDDTEFLIKKCADFWKLVEGSETLQNLKVLPQKQKKDTMVTSKGNHSIDSSEEDDTSEMLSAIQVMKKKGRILDDCFMNKMKTRHCEEGSGDYFLDLPQNKPTTKWSTPRKQPSVRLQREEAAKLCSELEQWDKEHPKSMEPPDHGAPLTYMVRQQN